ncbi:MAG: hypothetical protein GX887_06385 [Firmicutes bacterium]|nr:hypothetical protein [Bacillota bacterium]
MGRYNRYGWAPYVTVAERRAKAAKKVARLKKQGMVICPVDLQGRRKIAGTFWGQGWCDHLEKFSDYANRLPRGRSYLRNGSVCHLEITTGNIRAMVIGTQLYDVHIEVKPLPDKKWNKVKEKCSGEIGSLIELLQGKLSENIMSVVTDKNNGLFPVPKEIELNCSCPDCATMCKHVAAVLYGVGARLDEEPELLFVLRGVNYEELISFGAEDVTKAISGKGGRRRTVAETDLSDVFGIDITETGEAESNTANEPSKKIKRTGKHTKRKKKK